MSEKSGSDVRPGWFPFDLLHDPVPANKGRQGRPQACYVPEKFESMIRAFARGWPKVRVARAHGLSVPTMDKVYFATPEQKRARDHAIDIFEMEIDARLDQQSRAGNTGATKALASRMDKARANVFPLPRRQAAPKKGVKEQRQDDAWAAGIDDDWGPDMYPDGLPN